MVDGGAESASGHIRPAAEDRRSERQFADEVMVSCANR